MNCLSCSRNTLTLFIRSVTAEYRTPLIRTLCPSRALSKPQPFSTARSLRSAEHVSEATPQTHIQSSDKNRKLSRKERRFLQFGPPRPDNPSETPPSSTPKEPSPKERRLKKLAAARAAQDAANEPKPKKEPWQIQKKAIKEKLGDEAWNPRKKLSPDALEGIRHLHKTQPERFTTPVLAEYFKVSPEAIRRILRSKWQPTDAEADARLERWDKRGERIWSSLVELGVKPPKKWREMGVGRARAGGVPNWKGKSRNRVTVNDSVRDDIIPIVDRVTEEAPPQWQKTPIASRII